MDFSRIYFDLILFKKMQKQVLYLHRTRGADEAHGTQRMRRGTQGHEAAPRRPTRRGGTDTWQGHTSPRGCPSGTT